MHRILLLDNLCFLGRKLEGGAGDNRLGKKWETEQRKHLLFMK